ncbi:GNAT family N-acetyltransferase [Clostridium sp. FP2]|uniref:GNAT family N-acetyltransferase n=1 Tax=Clostridium TaxID=1485 RepID=UPI0013E975AA|nr:MULTISPECIES: GNAT family N-acetyltransferase [Clostridium]MBW9157787.1 GNAT family N-acetyltransferase [Clostridium tagluense]MBZ9623864.1 GNAT family N-acetyltransferase [Clostridium sp. FP2]WLC63764.1 GNAT family N-acetyltransferase [Clostridium tagluense]
MDRKVLESERLLLMPLSFNELSYISNNEINNIETIIELEAISNFVKSAILKKLDKMQNISEDIHEWYTYWLIINKDNQTGIGFIGFKGLLNENGYSEVGYSISTNYRKQKLMTEALEALVKWACGFRECKGIIARVLKTNVGSNKVLNNCNFKVDSSTAQEDNYILVFR